ncbi:glycosyltransferase family 39 protein [Novosphingobium album (ex Hu et al. 2023)]|uniref:Glycosyltransferase family 39 protein n=1 Tax=Novosphingobium album (ex Hu et al. 2023) TaxID=2930093 RepID=A0ABT0B5X2_9SPHN|nr:glycosyltransferase family 39 protein [Novosphingobium album (ex Hu et al. 2023)]MCJ2180471.1 glycosyltransferase family 39 protein [Novosphingobium album (ex Hu et al. 2023)]
MSADILHFPTRPSRLALRLEWFGTERSLLLMIWALYFALRVAALLAEASPSPEADWHFAQAASPAAGHGDGGVPEAPGWKVALSLVFAQFGASAVTVGLFNLACTMLSGLLTLALGRRLFRNEAAARAGLLLLAILPGAIARVPLALPETFLTTLLLAGSWAIVTRTSRWQLVGAGLILGFAALVNPLSVFIVPLLFAVDWLTRKDGWRAFPPVLGECLLVLAICVLMLLPWVQRSHDLLTQWSLKLPVGLPGMASFKEAVSGPGLANPIWRAAFHADLAYCAVLMLGFIAAFPVMLIRRRRDGQRWAGWWLLPYAAALWPVLAFFVRPGPPLLLHPVMPLVCASAGWLGVMVWQSMAERGRPRPTLH